ncbi:cytochrome c biogenesis CcdA family protein, partial [Gordonia aichiensis]
MGQTFADTVTSGPLLLALAACVIAGLVSFASPCVVPLVPGYLSYLAGLVGAEAPAVTVGESPKRGRSRVAIAAALFVLGFTVVFDHVLLAVDEVEPAVGIHEADVAGVQRPLGNRL